ncbi:MAG TPA: methyltransferase domain-containing protein [Bacteroidetes bacterium]|nr:methyltransferase domain-containing protein [Bacteroidota bacterium]
MARSHKRSRSWDPVADWYIGWNGKRGDRHTAIPAVMHLLALQPGERVLDLGCGPGPLARHVAGAGALYTGLDASPRLLRFARRHHGDHGVFLHGDATRLPDVRALQPSHFDAVVFLLSIQDVDLLEAAVRSAAWALDSGGRLVVLMTHPCFRVRRASNWGWDPGRRRQYRRVDAYLSPRSVPMRAYGAPQAHPKGRGHSVSYHRPLPAYAHALAAGGFAIDRMEELPTFERPEPGPRQKAEARAWEEIPLFLAIRAVWR